MFTNIEAPKTIVIGAVFQMLGYAIQAAAPPFSVFAIAYLFSGFGIAFQVHPCFSFHPNETKLTLLTITER